MPDILIIFLILICSFTLIIICIGEIVWYRKDLDIDSKFLNEDGDHIYYDRSIIEKKQFGQQYPHISIQSFSELFGREERIQR